MSSQGGWRGCHFTGKGRPPVGISKAMAQREEARRVLCSRHHHRPAAPAALPPGSAMAPTGTFGLRLEWASRVWTDHSFSCHLTRRVRLSFAAIPKHRDLAGRCSSRAANSVAGDVLPSLPDSEPQLHHLLPRRGEGARCCGGAGLSSHDATYISSLNSFLIIPSSPSQEKVV